MVDLAALFQNLLSGRMGGGSYDEWLKGLTPVQQQQGAQAPTVNGLGAMRPGSPMFGPDGKAISPFAIRSGYQPPPPQQTPQQGAFDPVQFRAMVRNPGGYREGGR